ncbi:hypothetical protein PM082_002071 [Marasmius tenuissimus]|nr:hypothetical protein PM082_002071 [Marasmius tenuissimus]
MCQPSAIYRGPKLNTPVRVVRSETVNASVDYGPDESDECESELEQTSQKQSEHGVRISYSSPLSRTRRRRSSFSLSSLHPLKSDHTRRLGAKGRRYIRGVVCEQDRQGEWRHAEHNGGINVLGGPGIGLGGMGRGAHGSGWVMWRAMCKARVGVLGSQIGAPAIRAYEAQLFGIPSPLRMSLSPVNQRTTVVRLPPPPELLEYHQQ